MPMSKERRDLILRIITVVLSAITIVWSIYWILTAE